MSDKVILTREGFDKLFEELTYLKTKKRVEVARQLESARAHGDLRENSEYETAKHDKQQLESRIAMLEDKLSQAKIVDPKDLPQGKAFLGARLEVKNLGTNATFVYMLVSQDEANINEGKISVTSPIGKGFLGRDEGDTVEIQVPAGKVKFQILRILVD